MWIFDKRLFIFLSYLHQFTIYSFINGSRISTTWLLPRNLPGRFWGGWWILVPGGAFGDCGIFEPPSQVQTGHPKNHRVVGSGSLLICHLGDLDGSFMQVNVVQVSLGRTQIPYRFWMEVLCGLQHSGNWRKEKKRFSLIAPLLPGFSYLVHACRLVLACHVVPCWLVGAHASWMEYIQKTHLDS